MAADEYRKKVGQGNRGMAFETAINHTNQMYAYQNIALINKRSTPVKVTRSKGTKVVSGYFENKSTVDYDGVYRGHSIVFEAKSLSGKSFPLNNVADHQYDYLDQAQKHGARSFLLIEFRDTREVFLLPYVTLKHYKSKADAGGRKSIPLEDFEIHAYGVEQGRGVRVDYLAAVERWMKG